MKSMIGMLAGFILTMTMGIHAQFNVTIDPDTILCGDGEAKITVQTTSTSMDLNCVARKGGGDFSEFKLVDGPNGKVQQAVFNSPFPGEVEIHVLDGKYNKIGAVNLMVIAPIIEILTEDMYDSIDFKSKSMPLVVSVADQKGNLIPNAKLVAKITEIVNKKQVQSNIVISPFVVRNGKYVARLTNLKSASYHVTVYDANHMESFEKAVSPDIPHPGTVLEGMNVEFD